MKSVEEQLLQRVKRCGKLEAPEPTVTLEAVVMHNAKVARDELVAAAVENSIGSSRDTEFLLGRYTALQQLADLVRERTWDPRSVRALTPDER